MKPSARDIVFFVTLLATAIALGGALAHYRGWNQLAYVLLVELTTDIGSSSRTFHA
jgi:hypothetical protein